MPELEDMLRHKETVTIISITKCIYTHEYVDEGVDELLEKVHQFSNLEILILKGSSMEALPEEMSKLGSLRKLDVSENRFMVLPSWIGGLTSLEELGIGYCGLTELPGWIGNLTGLKVLDARGNRFTELQRCIPGLKSLEEIDIAHNELTELPSGIGGLIGLKELDAFDNNLTKLSNSFSDLKDTLQSLDLKGNPLSSHGENGGLGTIELKVVFGNRVDLLLTQERVYNELDTQSPHWNRDMLCTITLEPIPKGTLSGEEALRIWDDVLEKHMEEDTVGNNPNYQGKETSNKERMHKCIRCVFGAEDGTDMLIGWRRMDEEWRGIFRDMLEAVITRMKQCITEGDRISEVKSDLLFMSIEIIELNPDELMDDLRSIYADLCHKSEIEGTLEYSVKNKIARIKENVFGYVVR